MGNKDSSITATPLNLQCRDRHHHNMAETLNLPFGTKSLRSAADIEDYLDNLSNDRPLKFTPSSTKSSRSKKPSSTQRALRLLLSLTSSSAGKTTSESKTSASGLALFGPGMVPW